MAIYVRVGGAQLDRRRLSACAKFTAAIRAQDTNSPSEPAAFEDSAVIGIPAKSDAMPRMKLCAAPSFAGALAGALVAFADEPSRSATRSSTRSAIRWSSRATRLSTTASSYSLPSSRRAPIAAVGSSREVSSATSVE
jgi:hypothetical protein